METRTPADGSAGPPASGSGPSPASGSAPADGSKPFIPIPEWSCVRCGELLTEGHSEVRRGKRPCGPCRAEMLGRVYLVAPTDVVPGLLLGARRRDELPADRPEGRQAIHRTLLAWGHALGLLLSQLQHFDQHLMETSPEEDVAEALMGTEPLAEARLRPLPAEQRALVLEGLPPEVARRLAKHTFATPPSCGEEDAR